MIRSILRDPTDPLELVQSLRIVARVHLEPDGVMVTWRGPVPWTLPLRDRRVRAVLAAQHDADCDESPYEGDLYRPLRLSAASWRRILDLAIQVLELGARAEAESLAEAA